MSFGSADHPLRSGWHERVGIDLPMRVSERDADLCTAVFEHEDVLHAGEFGQFAGAIGLSLLIPCYAAAPAKIAAVAPVADAQQRTDESSKTSNQLPGTQHRREPLIRTRALRHHSPFR